MNTINLLSPAEVKRLLAHHGLRPKKRLGQNFLIDRNILRKIIAAAELASDSLVLEIGPGLGTVTQETAQSVEKVVAVESDRELIPILKEIVGDYPNTEIVMADFLKLDLTGFLSDRFNERRCIVIANLPYYITTPLIIRLIEARKHISRMVLMVQEEVANRLTSTPGSSGYGSITVFVQYYCEVRTIAKAKRTVFYPAPEVDSTILRLDVRTNPAVDVQNEVLFFKIVRASFGQRRKTLLKSLSGSPELDWSRDQALEILEKAAIDPSRRGETLSLDEFASLANSAG